MSTIRLTDSLPAVLTNIEYRVAPTSTNPSETIFYQIRVFHAPTSTTPAYNVHIADRLSPYLNYIAGTWPLNNSPLALAATGVYTENLPDLSAYFPVISPTITAANPLVLRYQAVVAPNTPYGTLITNVATTTWTSLPDDPFGDTRTGDGGVDDYRDSDDAETAVSAARMEKTGPLTVTAGSFITYEIAIANIGPLTASMFIEDIMPFQVNTITATYTVSLNNTLVESGVCAIAPNPTGDLVVCAILAAPSSASVRVVIRGFVPPDIPLAADLTNTARMRVRFENGQVIDLTDTVDTEVLTEADVSVDKSGPATVTAGSQVSYTLVLSNSGPSVARRVDVKDLLPPGFTFDAASTTQGLCVSSICQLGDVAVGQVITMVVTATVGSHVTGTVTNLGQIFSSTFDPNTTNNTDTMTSAVDTISALRIKKVDLTDPVYAGDTYFYEIVITNTGPSDAQNVVVTDSLPSQITFQGASPECSHNGVNPGGQVTCSLGALAAGESRDFLINTRVNSDVVSGTLGLNIVTITTTTQVDTANSRLSDSELTRYLQPIGSPTDLAIAKTRTPASVIAGSGRVTYTLVVSNLGPAPTSAVQVVDVFPREFTLMNAATSRDVSTALCNRGVTCDLGEMAAGDRITITLVFSVPASAQSGVFTNTAHVSSPAPETNPNNNTAAAPVTVTRQTNLSIRKVAHPNPVAPGGELVYTILVTNSGPSDAVNVVVSDTLPAGLTLLAATPSQGGCAATTCALGVIPAGGQATIVIVATVAPTVTAPLTNTASVTSSTPLTNTLDDTDTVATPVSPSADLNLDVSSTPTAGAGQSAVVTYTVHNSGPSLAQNVVLTATFPPGVTPPTGWTQVGSSNVYTYFVGDVAPGQTVVITGLVGLGTDILPGTSIEFTGQVGSTTPDPDPLDNRDDADTSLLAAADLVIRKVQVSANPVAAGDLVTYTIVVTNTGPATAYDVDVKDQLPPGMALARVSASGGVCAGALCQFGALPVNATRTMTVVARLDSSLPPGALVNTAAVFSANDPLTPTNTVTVATQVTVNARLSIDKSSSPTATAGSAIRYTLVVVNHGPSTAHNLTVTDVLPADLRLIVVTSADPNVVCGVSLGVVTCTAATLPPGASVTIFVDAQLAADATGVMTNTASVASPSDPSGGDSDTYTTAVTTVADLQLLKLATPTAIAGESIYYTLTVINHGSSDAQNVVVTDTLPAGVTPTAASSECVITGNVVTCTAPTLAAYARRVFTITGVVASDVQAGVSLENRAVVGSTTPDPNDANNTANADTSIVGRTDLRLRKFGPATATAGEYVTYTVVVTNFGPSAAQSVDGKDSLPPQASLVSAHVARSGAGVAACAGALCQVGNMPAGEVITMTVVARIDPGFTGLLTNTATVFAVSPISDTANTTDSVATQVDSVSHLSVFKTGSLTGVAGEAIRYTILVTNAGPSDAWNVVVTDTLPAAVIQATATAFAGSCTVGAGLVVCSFAHIPAHGGAEIVIAGVLASTARGAITNTVIVSASNAVTDALGSHTTQVTGRADLALHKEATPTAIAGGLLYYTLTVRNLGPSSATEVHITDTLPVSITLLTYSNGCVLSGNLVRCSLSSLAVGASASFTFSARTDSRLRHGVSIENQAVVSAAEPDPDLANNHDDADTSIIAVADLALAKTGPDVVTAGERITYTIVLTNQGPSLAELVDVKDSWPPYASLDYTTIQRSGAGLAGCSGAICQAQDLAAGEVVTITLAGVVGSNAAANTHITNTAVTFSATPDPDLGDNSDDATTVVETLAKLRIDKRDLVDPVEPGGLIAYVISVTNDGPSDAVNVIITDELPPDVTYMSSTGACTQLVPNELLRCTLGTVRAGETQTILIVVQVADTVPSGARLRNVATVTTDTPISPDSIVRDAEDTRIEQSLGLPADLSLEKRVTPAVAQANGLLTFTVVVTNHGPQTATQVEVVDALPTGLTLVSIASSQGMCNAGILCKLGVLPANATATITIVTRIASGVSQGTTLTNTALVDSAQQDPTPENNLDSAGAAVDTLADLMLLKQSEPNLVAAGGLVAYRLSVTNLGPATAVAAVVNDTLPSDTTLVSAPDFCALNGAALTCALGDLPAGATRDIDLVLRTGPGMTGVFTNTATVGSQTQDPNPLNNTDSATNTARLESDLQVFKRASAGQITAGTIFSYTLEVLNLGPSIARNVPLVDPLPAELTLIDAAPPPNGGLTPPTWIIASLYPATATTVTLTVRANEAIEPGRLIVNTAVVSVTTCRNEIPPAYLQAATEPSSCDPNPGNNAATQPVQSFGEADVEITKTALITVVDVGGQAVYVVRVHNRGPSLAQDVDVKELLPPGLILQDLQVSQGACAGAICQLGSVAVSNTVLITAIAQVAPGTPPGTVLENRAAVFADTPDPNPNNNDGGAAIIVGPIADLTVSKVADRPTLTRGEPVTYTIEVKNLGPDDAPEVIVTDTLPSGLSYMTDTGNCALVQSNVVVCQLGLIKAGETRSFLLAAMVAPDAPSPVINSLTVGSPRVFDPVDNNNAASVTNPATGNPTAITLVSLTAESWPDGVHILWSTAVEIDAVSFNVLRSEIADGTEATTVNPEPIWSRGGSGGDYLFIDQDAAIGVVYYYWLEEIDQDGRASRHGPVMVQHAGAAGATPTQIFLPVVVK